ISAWTGPTAPAPNGNVAAPLNASSSQQTKNGPLIINYDGVYSPGLEVLGPIQIVDGTQADGNVLTSDANGLASWQPIASSSGPINVSCPEGEFVQGFDSMGNISCDYASPIALVTLTSDKESLVTLTGTSVTRIANSGGNVTSSVFADPANGMPKDGRALLITRVSSNENSAHIVYPCPAGLSYGGASNGATGMSNGICLYQQPTSTNNYTTKVWLSDNQSGSHTWTFSLGYAISGCMDQHATNYDSTANVSSGACTYAPLDAGTLACHMSSANGRMYYAVSGGPNGGDGSYSMYFKMHTSATATVSSAVSRTPYSVSYSLTQYPSQTQQMVTANDGVSPIVTVSCI
ncbi:MAG: hypothetical protein WCQ60_03890, partial [bacterium]